MAYLKFITYKVTEMNFKLMPETPGEKNFRITPKIRMDFKENQQNMVLAVSVTIDRHQETPTPFELSLTLTASFEIANRGDLVAMRAEASRIVFPYVRATVSNLTVNANMPAYFLPYLDFENMQPQAGAAPQPAQTRQGDSVIIRPLDEENI